MRRDLHLQKKSRISLGVDRIPANHYSARQIGVSMSKELHWGSCDVHREQASYLVW